MVENKVRERRESLGMTLEQLAEASGVPVSTISEIERGREPKVLTALKLSIALDKTIPELWPC